MKSLGHAELTTLDVDLPIWNHFFMVAPLVLVGTREPDGRYDLAPKHMATPLGWGNYFGFVCTPRHSTYHNALRQGVFTVSFPRPTQVVLASLAAAPRCADRVKPSLQALPTFAAEVIDGRFIEDGYLFLECETDRVVDGFGENSLVAGRVVAAHVDPAALRLTEQGDGRLIREAPLLAYLPPGRYTAIEESHAFPFPDGFNQ